MSGAAATPRHRFILLLAHAVIAQAIVTAYRPTISYILVTLDTPAIMLGLVVALFSLPALFLALPMGSVIDRLGERLTTVTGSALFVVGIALTLVGAHSVLLVALASTLVGVGHLLVLLSQQTFVANMTSSSDLDARFSAYTIATSLGQLGGPLLLALPGGSDAVPPIGVVLMWCAVGSALLLVLGIPMKSNPPSKSQRARLWPATRGLLRMKGVPAALVAGGVVLASLDIFIAYVPAIGHERGIPAWIIAFMLAGRSLFTMLSRLSLVRLIRVVGRRRLMVSAVTISALTIGALGLPVLPAVLAVLSCLYGFAVGICQPLLMSWLSELAPPGRRGVAMALRVTTNRLAQTALPAAFGLFAAVGGGAVLLGTGATLLVAAWLSSGIADPGSGRRSTQ